MNKAMISVVIPTLNAERRLGTCLSALIGAVVDGIVREVIVVDGGSKDGTINIAEGFGARIASTTPGRGVQLAAGARAVKSDWVLFLHADTILEAGWAQEAIGHMNNASASAAYFTLRFDAKDYAAAVVAKGAMARANLFKLPYGDQGFLISRALYQDIGGYSEIELFEDVEIVRRLVRKKGRGALHCLSSVALTSAERFQARGYAARVLRNNWMLARYFCGASPGDLAKAYRA